MWISCGRTVNKLWKTRGNEREFDSVGEFQNQARFERGFAVFRACKPNSPTLSNSRYLEGNVFPIDHGCFSVLCMGESSRRVGIGDISIKRSRGARLQKGERGRCQRGLPSLFLYISQLILGLPPALSTRCSKSQQTLSERCNCVLL